jgi:hypothetical protein
MLNLIICTTLFTCTGTHPIFDLSWNLPLPPSWQLLWIKPMPSLTTLWKSKLNCSNHPNATLTSQTVIVFLHTPSMWVILCC